MTYKISTKIYLPNSSALFVQAAIPSLIASGIPFDFITSSAAIVVPPFDETF